MLESLLSIMSRKSSLAHTYTFFVLNLQGLKFDIQQQQLKKTLQILRNETWLSRWIFCRIY